MEIQNLLENWHGHSGIEVENFIKEQLGNKIGYIYRFDTQKTIDVGGEEITEDACYILGFIDQATFEEWLQDQAGINDPRVVCAAEIPTTGSGYAMTLDITPPASVQGDSNFNVAMTATSTYTTGGVSQEIYEPVLLTIQTSYDGNSWSRAGTYTINSGTETLVPMNGLLPTGSIYVRIFATGFYATSVAAVFQVRIINLNLQWVSLINTKERLSTDDSLSLSFNVTGAVLKNLVVQFDGEGSYRQYVASLPANVTETTYNLTINSSDVQDILIAGTHIVHAYLEYYADGINIVSNPVDAEYIVSDGNLGIIAINDIATGLSNFTSVTFFHWFVNKNMEVNFSLVDRYNNTIYIPPMTQQADPYQQKTLSTQLNIEGVEDQIIQAVIRITDGNGNQLHSDIPFDIDNIESYAPVTDARFVLAPSIRSNDEPDRATIVNSNTIISQEEDFDNFDFITDGWISRQYNGKLTKVLRVPALRQLTMHYNPFSDLVTPSANNATFEIDFIVDNIIDTTIPLITVGTVQKGLIIYPDHAILRTANLSSDNSQNVAWAEGKRIHLAVTITSGEAHSYVRMYVNGVMDREFSYNFNTDSFSQSGATITIGNNVSDVDIFSIRCYNYGLTSRQICQDYVALMSSLEEKNAFSQANDITDDSDNISWSKCLGKYNVIGHTGPLLYHDTINSTQKVNLEIHFANPSDGNSIIMQDVDNKGQGTTAMTYYWWNQQYSITDDTKLYHIDDVGMENPLSISGYALTETEPLAKKLVGKVNFASSMQSHKLGLTWAYTDLYKQMLGTEEFGNDAPSQFSIMGNNVRLAVYEKPFLFFQREREGDPWVFRNLMTFGAGKGDKPTFGFKDATNKTPNMFMVEGADNNAQLALFNMPWDDNYIEYVPSEEAWCYPGTTIKNINFGFGRTDSNKIPNNPEALNSIKNFFNFVYLHSTRIEYGGRTPSELSLVGNDQNTPQKWIGQGDVYRWDVGSNSWVSVLNSQGEQLNIVQQYAEYTDGAVLNVASNPSNATDKIITARVSNFKKEANNYFHVMDALFHYCFIKFFAGTDNRAKNTYYYTDPSDLKIRWFQDDLDTVLKTNNSGLNIKPYWVEEHTKDERNTNYWSAENSVFNLLLEAAYDHDTVPTGELFSIQTVMRAMMTAMTQLGNGSVMGFMEKYILSTQDYFPATAYNAQAKWVYEYAYEHHNNPPLSPLAQSCGSQRWSEYQWLVDRIMFISSWCQFGEFQSGTAAGGQQWRAHDTLKRFTVTPAKYLYPRFGQGSSNVGVPQLVEPGEDFTSSVALQADNDETLAIRGNNYLWKMGDMDTKHKDNSFKFSGARLREITVNPEGQTSAMWEASQITVDANNIERFIIRNATSITDRIDLSKCVRLAEIDLRGCSNLVGLDIPKTNSLTSLLLPSSLTDLIIEGKNIETLQLEGTSQLTRISVIGNSYLNNTMLTVLRDGVNNSQLDQVTYLKFRDVDWTVSTTFLRWLLSIQNVDITGIVRVNGSIDTALALQVLNKFPNALEEESNFRIIYNNPIAVTRASINIEQNGTSGYYIDTIGDYQANLTIYPIGGNNIKHINWDVHLGEYQNNDITGTMTPSSGIATIDSNGLLHVTKLNDVDSETNIPDTTKITIVVTIETTNQQIIATLPIGLYYRNAEVGDFVYADGTWSDIYNPGKTLVGGCIYSEPDIRIMFPAKLFSSKYVWGVYQDTSSQDYPGLQGLATTTTFNPYNIVGIPNSKTVPSWYSMQISSIYDTSNNKFKVFTYKIRNSEIDITNGTVQNGQIFKDKETINGLLTVKTGDSWEWGPEIVVSAGEINTRSIIEVRDQLLDNRNLDSVSSRVNSTTSEKSALDSLINTYSNTYDYLCYYPAASYCHAYQPEVKPGEILNEKFTAHHWYLPSQVEIALFFFYYRLIYINDPTNSMNKMSRFFDVINEEITSKITFDLNNYFSNTDEYWNDKHIMSLRTNDLWQYQNDNTAHKGKPYITIPFCRF